jgi:hypothetical protein
MPAPSCTEQMPTITSQTGGNLDSSPATYGNRLPGLGARELLTGQRSTGVNF